MPTITEQASRIIDAVRRPDPVPTVETLPNAKPPPPLEPLEPREYAKALPSEAGALARVLEEPAIIKAAADFADADRDANAAQTQFRRLGARAAYSGFLAALLGGLVLYLGEATPYKLLRANLGLGQFIALAVSLLCAFLLYRRKPFRAWREQRAKAEALRLHVFDLIMNAQSEPKGAELPVLPLQLECFRRHLLDGQREFFWRRGTQQRRTLNWWRVVGALAVMMALAPSVPQVLRLDQLGLLPALVMQWIARVPLDAAGYALVGLLGGSLQSLLAVQAVIAPVQRNAEKYLAMHEKLEELSKEKLASARAAAVAGNGKAVREFTTSVANELSEEGREWRLLHQALTELVLTQLANQRKA